MEDTVRISLCIVTYNSADKIAATLESIYRYTDSSRCRLTVYVADNASEDDTVRIVRRRFPQVRLLRMKRNTGFGHANNAVLKDLDSDYHFILNPDILLRDDILNAMAGWLSEHPDVVMAVPKFYFADGTEQFTPKRCPTFRYVYGGRLEKLGDPFRRWRSEYTLRGENVTEPVDVDFCSGCFIAVRTSVFRDLGGFDRRYFLYGEDADLTRMAKRYGRTVYTPQFAVTHLWERASAKSPRFFLIHMHSMIQYFYKWRFGGRFAGRTS